MIKSLAIILIVSAIGDAAVEVLHVPIPGSALGMTLLGGWFAMHGELDATSARLFDGLAPHLPLFFVAPAVGIIASTELLSHAWLYIGFAVLFGTAVTIGITGLVTQFLLRPSHEVQSQWKF